MSNQFTDSLSTIGISPLDFSLSPSSIIFYGSSLTLAGQDYAYNYAILKFQTISAPPIYLSYSINYNQGQTYTLALISTTQYFAGGYYTSSVAPNDVIALIEKITETSTTTSTSQYYTYPQAAGSSFYFVKNLAFKSGIALVSIMENSDPTQGVIYTLIPLDSNNDMLGTGQYNGIIQEGGLSIKCHGIYVTSVISQYGYFQIGTEMRALNLVQTYYQWITFPITDGQMTQALILGATDGYYIGYLNRIDNIQGTRTYTYTKQVGFLMKYVIDSNTCLVTTYTWSAQTNFVSTITLTQDTPSVPMTTWQDSNPTYLSQSLELATASYTITDLLVNNAVNKNWCTPTYTLKTPNMYDQAYMIGSSTKQISYGNFGVTQVCTDTAFSYTALWIDSGGILQSLPSFITLTSPTSRKFLVDTSDTSYVGTYIIQITGVVNNFQEITKTFNLDLNLDPCTDNVITTINVANSQIYNVVSGVPFILGSAAWTESMTGCPSISFSFTTSAYVAFNPGWIYISGTDIIIYTTNLSDCGTFDLILKGTQATYQTHDVSFTVILNSCDSATLVTSVISDQIYDIFQATSMILATNPIVSDQPTSYCSSIVILTTYDFTTGTNVVFPSNYVVPSGTNVLIYTDNPAYVGNVVVKVYGSLLSYTQTTSILFNLQIIDTCINVVTINETTPFPNTQTYDIWLGSAFIIGYANWTKSLPQCKPITYTFFDTDTNAAADAIFFTSGTYFYVSTNLKAKVKLYNLKVIGSTIHYGITYASAFEIIPTIDVWDSCANATISTNIAPDLTYDIQSGISMVLVINTLFVMNPTYCPTIQLTIFDITSGSELAFDPVIHSNTGTSISVNTVDGTKKGIYQLIIYGTISTYPITISTTFQLTIYDSCDPVTISTLAITASQTYDIWQGSQMNIGNLAWTISIAYCPVITFNVLETTTSTLNDPIFTISGGILYVNTNLVSKVGTYHLKVTGEIIGTYKTYQTQSESFTLNIIDSCVNTVINFQSIPSYTPFDVINSQVIIASLTGWTQTLTYCPTLTFSIIDQNTLLAANSIFQVSAVPQLKVVSSIPADSGYYYLTLVATVLGYKTKSSNFEVEIYACSQTLITTPTIVNQNYYIGISATILVNFIDYVESIGKCGTFTYTLSSSPSTSMITLTGKQLQIHTINDVDSGTYLVSIIGILSNGVSSTLSFKLYVYPFSNTAPYFISPLRDQSVVAGQKTLYTLPSIKDDENDGIAVLVRQYLASSFINYQNGKFLISPTTSDVGTHTISITIKDDNFQNPMGRSYQFNIEVLAPNNSTLSKILQDIANQTITQSDTSNSSNAGNENVTNFNKTNSKKFKKNIQ